MVIPKELLLEAIATSHTGCINGCIHADAVQALQDEVERTVVDAATAALMTGNSPSLSVFLHGIHVGYHLRELETKPIDQTAVN